jgi:hypothetical protein
MTNVNNSSGSNESGVSSVRNKFLFLFLGAFLIFLAFLPVGIQSIDGGSMLMVADAIVTQHTVAIPGDEGTIGRDGRNYSNWYPLQSVLALPVVAATIKASGAVHLPVRYLESFTVNVLPALYTALTVALVYLLSLSLGGEEAGAWLAAIVYAFGTIAMVYTRGFYADPLLALLVALGFLITFRLGPTWWIVPVTACAALAKPTGVILGAVLSAYLLWKTRHFWMSILPGIGTSIGLGLYFLYNYQRFGNPLTFGQPWTFSFGFVPQGLAGILFSPGGGLFWYCPCAFLALVAIWKIKGPRLEAWAILAFAGLFLLLHCCWRVWAGGWSWGPRLLLPIVPGLVALTGVLNRNWRRPLAILAVLTFLLTVPNLFASYQRFYAETTEQGISENNFRWQPRYSLLLNMWPAALRQIRDARQNDVRQLFAEHTETSATTIATSRALRIVAVWWWVLPVAHISRVWGILVSLLLTITGIVLLVRAKPLAAKAKESGDILPVPAVIT